MFILCSGYLNVLPGVRPDSQTPVEVNAGPQKRVFVSCAGLVYRSRADIRTNNVSHVAVERITGVIFLFLCLVFFCLLLVL